MPKRRARSSECARRSSQVALIFRCIERGWMFEHRAFVKRDAPITRPDRR
jgi:hypothetical protein